MPQIGEAIGQALLPGEMRLRFEASLRSAIEAGEGLRLCLRIRDEELSAIPWEAARIGEEYLALRHATPIVRYVPAPEPPSRLSISGPVQVLGMISSPIDQDPLAVNEEKDADGWPVDAAVVEGRKAIVNALNNDPDQPDWVHPVLYMRAPDGVLFG